MPTHNKFVIYSITAAMLSLLLTSCTDVRNRLSPDVLAVDQMPDGSTQFAMRCSQETEIITADADSPLLLCSALQTAAGKEIDSGHISLLMLHGNPAALIPTYLEMQVLMPTSEVLLCTDSACAMPQNTPDAKQIRAAVSAGMLPACTADRMLGDLQNGSGVSAVCCDRNGTLTLALCDANGICGTLSADACRGLALSDKRWTQFSLTAGESTVSVTHVCLHISAAEAADRLLFTLRGTVTCKPKGTASADWQSEAQRELTAMLSAAYRETAQSAGADLLLLREAAVRDRISGAADCALSVWRERLQASEISIEITVHSSIIG